MTPSHTLSIIKSHFFAGRCDGEAATLCERLVPCKATKTTVWGVHMHNNEMIFDIWMKNLIENG